MPDKGPIISIKCIKIGLTTQLDYNISFFERAHFPEYFNLWKFLQNLLQNSLG